MAKLLLVAALLSAQCDGWWYNRTEPPPRPSDRWQRFQDQVPETEAWITRWWHWSDGLGSDWRRYWDETTISSSFDLNLWLVVDTISGLAGWAVFGNAWGGVKQGCQRILRLMVVLTVCVAAHYLWSVCYPVVSILIACLMAVVWILRRLLNGVGTVFFYAQKLAGGAPEAADAVFHGPGTGAVPETAVLRSFKRTGDNPKQVVVRRGDDVAVFSVGSDTQSIRTHGLYLPVELDSVRGSPSLVRRIKGVDRVHLCRNSVCTEEAAEHFTEYGVVQKFNAERFQLSQSHQGALSFSRQFWEWFVPRSRKTVTEVVGKIREYASESETEDISCCASQITWMSDEGLKSLADSKCSSVGQPFHQALEGDVPGNCTGSLCTKHATLYLSKRHMDKCAVMTCNKYGCKLRSGVRWCAEHVPGREVSETPGRRSRSRSRVRSRQDDGDAEDGEGEAADEEVAEEEERTRALLRGAAEAAEPPSANPA